MNLTRTTGMRFSGLLVLLATAVLAACSGGGAPTTANLPPDSGGSANAYTAPRRQRPMSKPSR